MAITSATQRFIFASNQTQPAALIDFSTCVVSASHQNQAAQCWDACKTLAFVFDRQASFLTSMCFVPEALKDLHLVPRDSTTFDHLSTRLTGSYQVILPDLDRLAQNDPALRWELYSDEPGQICECYRLAETEMEEQIEVGHCMFEKGNRNPHGSFSASVGHPTGRTLEAALINCGQLYNQIIRVPISVQDTPPIIAKLHWWLVNTAPFKQTPNFMNSFNNSCTQPVNSIFAEIFIAALTIHKFRTLTPYHPGVNPEHLALTLSCEEFVKIYPSLRQ